MKILVIVSGLSSRQVKDWEIKNHFVATINNAWKIYPDFHFAFYAGDLPKEDIPVSEHRDRMFISDLVGPYRNKFTFNICRHALQIGNVTSLVMTLYWMLWYSESVGLDLESIGLIGCDLNYEPDENGFTHFYGIGRDILTTGIPDPFREKGKYDLIAQLININNIAKNRAIELINYSDDPKSLLPFRKGKFHD
jgi:hypothetical protein